MDPAAVRRDGFGSLAALPDHLLNMVLLHLNDDAAALAALGCTSKAMRVLACEEPLWQQLCLRLGVDVLPESEPLTYQANWRQTALGVLARHASSCAEPAGARRVPPPAAVEAAARPPAPVPLQSDFLYRRWLRCHMHPLGHYLGALPHEHRPWQRVQRMMEQLRLGGEPDGEGVLRSAEEFRERFDWPSVPCVLRGAMDDWPQGHDWSFAGLLQRYGDAAFNVSPPGLASRRCVMRMRDYVDYIRRQADEEPLYVFDGRFGEVAPAMLAAYRVPAAFDQDFFSVLGAESRPPYRWVVAGPSRSGASWHVDPQMTSAWNALCAGRKRWALYPPTWVPPGMGLTQLDEHTLAPDDAFTSLQWYLEVYPTLSEAQRPLEFIQEPGEVVFVPGGWWHLVLNLEDSVAVTQNFVSTANLDRVVCYLAHGSLHFHTALQHYYSPAQLEAWEALENGSQQDGSDGSTSSGSSSSSSSSSSGWETDAGGSSSDGGSDAEERLEFERAARVPLRQQCGELGLPSAALPAVPCSSGSGGGGGPECACGGGGGATEGARLAWTLASVALHDGDDSVEEEGEKEEGGGQRPAASLPAAWPSRWGLPVAPLQRDRQLGRWLRALLRERPALAGAARRALARHAGLRHWRAALGGVAAAHGLALPGAPGPKREGDDPRAEEEVGGLLGLLPDNGTDSLVFRAARRREEGGGSVVVKLVVEPAKPVAGLMAALEASVPGLLGLPTLASTAGSAAAGPAAAPAGPGDGSAAPLVPACVGQGVLEVTFPLAPGHDADAGAATAEAEGARGRQVYPYVVLSDVGHAAVVGAPGSAAEVAAGAAAGRWVQLKAVLAELDGAVAMGAGGEGGGPEQRSRGDDEEEEAREARMVPLAEQLGRMVAALHVRRHLAARGAAGLAAAGVEAGAAGVEAGGVEWGEVVRRRAWWHDRAGNVWVSGGLGQCVRDGRVSAGGQRGDDDKDVAGGGGCWAPFVSFLRSRAAVAAEELEDAGPLPENVLQQVRELLAATDPAVVLAGVSSSRPAPAPAAPTATSAEQQQQQPPPVLMHTDLNVNNVYVAAPQRDVCSSSGAAPSPPSPPSSLLVLDFADAGHGDPLYDVLTVHASAFHYSARLLGAFWAAYRRQLAAEARAHGVVAVDAGGPGGAEGAALAAVWPRRPAAWRASRAAMLYALLHEESHMLSGVFAMHAEALRPLLASGGAAGGVGGGEGAAWPAWLERLAELVWGALDGDGGADASRE